MKKIIIAIIVTLLLSFNVTAQEKMIKKITDNYYSYTENTINDPTHQKGFYKKINNKLIREGNWKLYINGKLETEAVYVDDKIKLLVVDGIEYSANDLKIIKLERKVERLIADSN